MNEFETLDHDLSDREYSQKLLSYSKSISLWAKIIAFVNLALLGINLITIFTQYARISHAPGAEASVFVGILVVGVAVALYIALLKFANKLNEFSLEGTENALSNVMYRQRVFWQFAGILLIVLLFFMLIAFAFAISSDFTRFR